jgi:hypothetical protein
MITRDAWLKALKDATTHAPLPPSDPNVLTVNELAPIFGLSPVQTSRRVRMMVDAGKAVQTTKTIRQANGVLRVVPAYRLAHADAES